MQKNYQLKAAFITSLAITGFLITSCNELDEVDLLPKVQALSDLQSLSDKEMISYADNYLSMIGKEILINAPEQEFKDKLYNEVEKKFDGEHNVLVKTLHSSNFNSSKINSSLKSVKIKDALDAFNKKVDTSIHHPQVYIPFYSELKQKKLLGKRAPILVINTEDKPDGEYPGYQLDENNKLVKLDKLIKESDAQNNEVWVISINERVTSKGELKYKNKDKNIIEADNIFNTLAEIPEPYYACSTGYPGGGDGNLGTSASPSAPGPNGIDVRLYMLRISSHKESWASGGSEINLATTTIWENGQKHWLWTSSGGPLDMYAQPQGDYHMGEWSRNEVSNNTRKMIDKSITQVANYAEPAYCFWGTNTNRAYDQRGPIIYYALYELDDFPTGYKQAYVRSSPIPGFVDESMYNVELVFRSADREYNKGYIHYYKGAISADYSRNYPCLQHKTTSSSTYTLMSTTPFTPVANYPMNGWYIYGMHY